MPKSAAKLRQPAGGFLPGPSGIISSLEVSEGTISVKKENALPRDGALNNGHCNPRLIGWLWLIPIELNIEIFTHKLLRI